MSSIVSIPDAAATSPPFADCTVLFTVDNHASPYADAMKRNEGFQLMRSIFMNIEEGMLASASLLSSRVKVSEVWINTSASVVLVNNLTTIPAALSVEWLESATKDIQVKFALVLDGIYIRHPLAERHSPSLRYITTSAIANSLVGEAIQSQQRLEVGQLVTSCSASIMAKYEQAGTAAVLLLCHKGLAYSVESAKCFGSAPAVWASVFGESPFAILTPLPTEFSRYVSIDPYLTNTGNLYS